MLRAPDLRMLISAINSVVVGIEYGNWNRAEVLLPLSGEQQPSSDLKVTFAGNSHVQTTSPLPYSASILSEHMRPIPLALCLMSPSYMLFP